MMTLPPGEVIFVAAWPSQSTSTLPVPSGLGLVPAQAATTTMSVSDRTKRHVNVSMHFPPGVWSIPAAARVKSPPHFTTPGPSGRLAGSAGGGARGVNDLYFAAEPVAGG